jgi:hypothetical protein
MEKKREVLWDGEYIALWSDGTIGVSDGVGYTGEETDIKGLYEALKAYFEHIQNKETI